MICHIFLNISWGKKRISHVLTADVFLSLSVVTTRDSNLEQQNSVRQNNSDYVYVYVSFLNEYTWRPLHWCASQMSQQRSSKLLIC